MDSPNQVEADQGGSTYDGTLRPGLTDARVGLLPGLRMTAMDEYELVSLFDVKHHRPNIPTYMAPSLSVGA